MAKKKKEEEDYSGTGYEDGQYPFVRYNRVVLRHNTNEEITRFVTSLSGFARFFS